MDDLFRATNLKFAYRVEPIINGLNWRWQKSENWAVVGGNGAGKTTLAKLLIGQIQPSAGELKRRISKIELIDFDVQRRLMERDARRDDSDFKPDAFDAGTTVGEVISDGKNTPQAVTAIAGKLGIAHILNRGIRFVSTGESRKALIARALLKRPEVLILDKPLEGLDKQSRNDFRALIDELIASETAIMLLMNAGDAIPQGLKVLTLETVRQPIDAPPVLALPIKLKANREHVVPIEIMGASVSFRGQPVLRDVHWRFEAHHHAIIVGPNGSGKSTLLGLIMGDNDKAYGQPVTLFGRPRGSGESVWDIKKHFGVVNTAMQLKHLSRQRVAEVVASGLFDSQGLYDEPGGEGRQQALAWIKVMGLSHLQKERMDQLSFGDQRLVLITRALVKSPEILVLDEPCIGLDALQRERVLATVDRVAEAGVQILFVSHHEEDFPACINQRVTLLPNNEIGSAVVVEEVEQLEKVEEVKQ